MSFNDLLDRNRGYAASYGLRGLPALAGVGLEVITCMDSRLDPLGMLGLALGDVKVLRTPGGHVTPDTITGCILGVHRLGVNRIMVIEHTDCALASVTDTELQRFFTAKGLDASSIIFDADSEQDTRVRSDVEVLRHHPLIGDFAEIGGFIYDVATGALRQVC